MFNRSEFTQSYQTLLQDPNKFELAYFNTFSLEIKGKLGAAFNEFIFQNRTKELMDFMKRRHPGEVDAALTQQRCGAVCLVLGARKTGEVPLREEQSKSPVGPKSKARGSKGPTGADASKSPALASPKRQLRGQLASPAAVGDPKPGHGPLGDANQEVHLFFLLYFMRLNYFCFQYLRFFFASAIANGRTDDARTIRCHIRCNHLLFFFFWSFDEAFFFLNSWVLF